MTLMLHEHSELLLMVVNSIKKDLEESNEYNNCLALHAIANVGSNEMAETLAPSVHRLLISPFVPATSRSPVQHLTYPLEPLLIL